MNKCPLYGQMETGANIDLPATKQPTVHSNLTKEVYPAQPYSSTKNSLIRHFFTILLHSRWTNVHFMGKWREGLKIDLVATKQPTVLFNLTKEVYSSPAILFKRKIANSAFFHNFASFQVNKCPLYGQMETGAWNRPRGNKAADRTL